MKITISNNDRNEMYRAAIFTAAKHLRIPNIDFTATDEIYKAITTLESPLQTSLDHFLTSYKEWYDFLDSKRTPGLAESENIPLTPHDETELHDFRSQRQEAMLAFNRALDAFR